MAPAELRRGETDFRVDVQKDVHARACTGGAIRPSSNRTSLTPVPNPISRRRSEIR
jgi:hypothetical protein